ELCEKIKANTYSFGIMSPLPGSQLFYKNNIKINREDYYKFKDSFFKIVDKKFIFAKHKISIEKLVKYSQNKYNTIFYIFNVSFLIKYLNCLFKSNAKIEYMKLLPKFLIKFIYKNLKKYYYAKKLSDMRFR
ncbi:MAG TPA: hypothetical protein PKY81_12360, partial [bacterium]|nr:hypothetical protein [bacterium]